MAGIGSVKKSEYTAIPDSSCFHAASVSSSLNTAGIAAGIRWLDGHLLLWAEAQFEVSQDAVNSRIKHVYPVVVLSGVSSCGNSAAATLYTDREAVRGFVMLQSRKVSATLDAPWNNLWKPPELCLQRGVKQV